jgi:transcriptional regulator with XRE-family HTH domain
MKYSDNDNMKKKFTHILSKALEGKNISEVAREIGMSRNLLQEWAKSGRAPSLNNIEYIKKLADYLGLTLEELLIGEEEKKIISSISFSDEGREYKLVIERTK